MKKIYSFTLSSDEYPSSSRKFIDDLRLIAHMVYSEIYNYYGEDRIVLNINNNIEYNRLNENYSGYKYRFDSDIYDDGYVYYEPFIVGNNTFCLTIIDESFTENIIEAIIDYVFTLLKVRYKVSINSFDYIAKYENDERYRNNAIKSIYDILGCDNTRKNRMLYTIIDGFSNKKRSRSINRKCFVYY